LDSLEDFNSKFAGPRELEDVWIGEHPNSIGRISRPLWLYWRMLSLGGTGFISHEGCFKVQSWHSVKKVLRDWIWVQLTQWIIHSINKLLSFCYESRSMLSPTATIKAWFMLVKPTLYCFGKINVIHQNGG
jgi:hypothetical protein